MLRDESHCYTPTAGTCVETCLWVFWMEGTSGTGRGRPRPRQDQDPASGSPRQALPGAPVCSRPVCDLSSDSLSLRSLPLPASASLPGRSTFVHSGSSFELLRHCQTGATLLTPSATPFVSASLTATLLCLAVICVLLVRVEQQGLKVSKCHS